MDRVNQFRKQLIDYFNRVGLYFPLPKLEDITYVNDASGLVPVGNIIQQEYTRASFCAIVKARHESVINIDPDHLTFVSKKPLVPFENDPAEIDKSAVRFISTTLHESVHFNGRLADLNQEVGSWQEATNEMITDFTTLTLITQAGIGQGYDEQGWIPDWSQKTGYYQLVKTAVRLGDAGLVTKEEMIKFGLNQDSVGFIKLLDQRLQQASPALRQRLLEELDNNTIIGPNQYDKLMAKADLTTGDIIRGILDFGKEVGAFCYVQPGALLIEIKDVLPEWEDRTPSQFLDWFRGKGGVFGSADKATRHKLVRDVIQQKNSRKANFFEKLSFDNQIFYTKIS